MPDGNAVPKAIIGASVRSRPDTATGIVVVPIASVAPSVMDPDKR